MITHYNDPDSLADKAMIRILTENLRAMYHQGTLDGTRTIMIATATSLQSAGMRPDCPDRLKDGLIEASKYLRSVADGKAYRLVTDDDARDATDDTAKDTPQYTPPAPKAAEPKKTVIRKSGQTQVQKPVIGNA